MTGEKKKLPKFCPHPTQSTTLWGESEMQLFKSVAFLLKGIWVEKLV